MRLAHISHEASRGPCGPLLAHTARLRIRPGETPAWTMTEAASQQIDGWRRDAEAVGMPLDGMLAARLELHLACAELEVSPRHLRTLTNGFEHELPRVPPAPLRDWTDLLGGTRVQPHYDELPEVVLPARLTHQLGEHWWRGLRHDALVAHRWELESARRGCTLRELIWRCQAVRAER